MLPTHTALHPDLLQRPDLIPDQRQERTDDHRQALRADDSRELIREALAAAGGHDAIDDTVVHGGVDDAFLTQAEGGEVERRFECGEDRVGPGEDRLLVVDEIGHGLVSRGTGERCSGGLTCDTRQLGLKGGSFGYKRAVKGLEGLKLSDDGFDL